MTRLLRVFYTTSTESRFIFSIMCCNTEPNCQYCGTGKNRVPLAIGGGHRRTQYEYRGISIKVCGDVQEDALPRWYTKKLGADIPQGCADGDELRRHCKDEGIQQVPPFEALQADNYSFEDHKKAVREAFFKFKNRNYKANARARQLEKLENNK
ncbi:uncharacterized protein LOC132797893 isoform X1 [Drosophila nasuta]|uniref:uncharacterized protein LOC132797893 isoform X1 n=1 Tax=Drosophila nasuta TaxID=42062 RepID=UPI00295E99C6|nr:uncharacterized protein LOC132797893 isoform X1 [Drosophila nasuta]XP_060665624.1 uncharacterized protein LOC132797893 isoform X1 [Drosophila nasuta]